MSPLRVLVLFLMSISLASSGYVFVKMLREISEAEGKSRIPLLAAFGGLLYLLHRYSQSVPNGRMAGWLFILLPADAILIGFYFVLGFH